MHSIHVVSGAEREGVGDLGMGKVDSRTLADRSGLVPASVCWHRFCSPLWCLSANKRQHLASSSLLNVCTRG